MSICVQQFLLDSEKKENKRDIKKKKISDEGEPINLLKICLNSLYLQSTRFI